VARANGWLKRTKPFFLAMVLVLDIFVLNWPGFEVFSGEPAKEEKESLQALLPKAGEISELEVLSEAVFYVPQNLWDYMDGQADVYLDYGFSLLVAREYGGADGSVITLEIYRMASPRHAFGIYAAERNPEDTPVKIGVQGYLGDNVLGFWKGPYYAKLICFRMSPVTKALLEKAGSVVANKIQGNCSVPELFSAFPEEFRVKRSERFIPRNFLGHPFLKNGYRVDYEKGGKSYQVFLLQEDSQEEAEDIFRRYQDFLQSQHEKITRAKKGHHQVALVHGEKSIALFQYGPFMGGVLEGIDLRDAEKIIQEIIDRLKARHP